MTAVILPYVNPDLDGTASAIALETLEPDPWSARVIGVPDEETMSVLSALGIEVPGGIEDWRSISRIWLVDTHHPPQLPHSLPNERVVRILDHHPGGEPGRYPNAEVQNECVGAAATLVAERVLLRSMPVPPKIAILLQAAIISNTLDFRATATSDRDYDAFERLRSVTALPGGLVATMRNCREAKLNWSSAEIVGSDVKTLSTPAGDILIAQLESPGALSVLARPDLRSALRDLARVKGAASAIVNLVDTKSNQTAIVATDVAVGEKLASWLGQPITEEGVIRLNRIVQRKSGIMPCFSGFNP